MQRLCPFLKYTLKLAWSCNVYFNNSSHLVILVHLNKYPIHSDGETWWKEIFKNSYVSTHSFQQFNVLLEFVHFSLQTKITFLRSPISSALFRTFLTTTDWCWRYPCGAADHGSLSSCCKICCDGGIHLFQWWTTGWNCKTGEGRKESSWIVLVDLGPGVSTWQTLGDSVWSWSDRGSGGDRSVDDGVATDCCDKEAVFCRFLAGCTVCSFSCKPRFGYNQIKQNKYQLTFLWQIVVE